MSAPKFNRFWSTVLTAVAVYGLVKWGIPAASRHFTTLTFPLSVPSTLMFIYMALTVVALFLLVTFSDAYLEEFLAPIQKLLRADYGKPLRAAVLTALPLLVGWQVYEAVVPKVQLPASLRIQHPSSNFPKSFETRKNPFALDSGGPIEAFIQEARTNKINFVPQLKEDIDNWVKETEPAHVLEFLAAPVVKEFLAQLKGGRADKETARAVLLEKHLFEGRALYAMNCRPCHGDNATGDGPMADGFKLRPINFTDNGTLETIVEGYTFWRVANGGPGLPIEATPWDSAMPEWKLNLTEAERWKIILAEYDLAEKTPRIVEGE